MYRARYFGKLKNLPKKQNSHKNQSKLNFNLEKIEKFKIEIDCYTLVNFFIIFKNNSIFNYHILKHFPTKFSKISWPISFTHLFLKKFLFFDFIFTKIEFTNIR